MCATGSSSSHVCQWIDKAEGMRQHRWKETSRFEIQVMFVIVKLAVFKRKSVGGAYRRAEKNPIPCNTASVTEECMPTEGRRRMDAPSANSAESKDFPPKSS